MNAPDRIRVPRQARSRETFDRFLDAVDALLTERDFAEITVADIVERAGRTVGSFYTRFADKNAALVALVERTWVSEVTFVRRHLAPDAWSEASLEDVVREGAVLFLAAYRNPERPFRSAVLLALDDEPFRHRRAEMFRELAEVWRALLLTKADEIGHPDLSGAIDRTFAHLVGVMDHLTLYGPAFDADEVSDEELVADLVLVDMRMLRASTGPGS